MKSPDGAVLRGLHLGECSKARSNKSNSDKLFHDRIERGACLCSIRLKTNDAAVPCIAVS